MLHSLLQELLTSIHNDQPVALTTLVETRGSTPQKAGAAMLVFPDGSQVGTLGGGCVEAEVKRRALQLLDEGRTEILTFNLDNDYGWDDGLICGGRMKMLVEPLRCRGDAEYFSQLQELLSAGRGGTEAIALDSSDAVAQAAGCRFLLDAAGQVLAARTGTADAAEVSDAVAAQLSANMRPLTARPRPYVQGGFCFLPHLERCRLLIVGAGHVGQKVAQLAAEVDFDVWVVDDRAEYCNPERFPLAKRLIVSEIDSALSGLDVDVNTMCIIVTRGHNHDEEALYHLAETPARYVGMIGSRRKIKLIFEDLLREGISREALERVHAPLGLHIGSQTVAEIAVSIVAELIAHRNLGSVPAEMSHRNLMAELKTPAPEQ